MQLWVNREKSSLVEHWCSVCGWRVTAQSHRLGSACQEVQDPVIQAGADSQITELGDQPGGDDCIEGGAEAHVTF